MLVICTFNPTLKSLGDRRSVFRFCPVSLLTARSIIDPAATTAATVASQLASQIFQNLPYIIIIIIALTKLDISPEFGSLFHRLSSSGAPSHSFSVSATGSAERNRFSRSLRRQHHPSSLASIAYHMSLQLRNSGDERPAPFLKGLLVRPNHVTQYRGCVVDLQPKQSPHQVLRSSSLACSPRFRKAMQQFPELSASFRCCAKMCLETMESNNRVSVPSIPAVTVANSTANILEGLCRNVHDSLLLVVF